MATLFNDGERVRYVGIPGWPYERNGQEGIVQYSFRDYDGNYVMVLFDGDEKPTSFEEERFELVKTTYVIDNSAEASVSTRIELSEREVELIQMVIDGLNDEKRELAPTLSIRKAEK